MNIISAVLLNMQKKERNIIVVAVEKSDFEKGKEKCAHFAHQNQITVRSLVKENQKSTYS